MSKAAKIDWDRVADKGKNWRMREDWREYLKENGYKFFESRRGFHPGDDGSIGYTFIHKGSEVYAIWTDGSELSIAVKPKKPMSVGKFEDLVVEIDDGHGIEYVDKWRSKEPPGLVDVAESNSSKAPVEWAI